MKALLLTFLFVTFQTAFAADEIIVLPNEVTGEYIGTVIWGSQPKISQNTIATVKKSTEEKLVNITFSGGIPGVDASTPIIKNFQFKATPGSQLGVYESVGIESSLPGVMISSYMTNMNIVGVVIGGVKVEFTGMKKKN